MRGIPDGVHQKILVMRVTFMSQEMQRVVIMISEDLVIHTTLTCNIMGAGSAPLQPQPSAFSGGGGGSGGGDGGGGSFSGHQRSALNHKDPLESFRVLPSSITLTTLNALHRPHVQSCLHAETQRR